MPKTFLINNQNIRVYQDKDTLWFRSYEIYRFLGCDYKTEHGIPYMYGPNQRTLISHITLMSVLKNEFDELKNEFQLGLAEYLKDYYVKTIRPAFFNHECVQSMF